MKRTVLNNLIFFGIALAVVGGIYWLNPAPHVHAQKTCKVMAADTCVNGFVVPLQPKLSEVDKEAIDLMSEMNKYLTAIAFGIIVVLGNILVGLVSRQKKETNFTLSLFIGSMILALCSLIFGYLLYTKLFELISNAIINLQEKQVVYAQTGQFYSLLLAAFLFVLYLFNSYFNAAKK